jgi:two-component system, LytTR family, sensor kinase
MKQSKYWLCQIGGWSIYGAYDTLVSYLSGRNIWVEGVLTLYFIAFAILLTHIYRYFIIKKFHWITLSLQPLLIRVIIASVAVGGLLASFVSYITLHSTERADFKFYFILVYFNLTFLLTLAWNLFYFTLKYINSNEALTIEKLQMASTVKDLELKNIKSSLQPHFIFNALNSIRSLIIENQEKARDAVMQLSNILRNSLISEKAELVELGKEWHIVQDFLSLESIRYEERLKIIYSVDKDCLQSLIPPMLLQTLAENAIKHGIAVSPNGGFIKINIAAKNTNKTIITIENTGNYEPTVTSPEGGFGIEASIKRLYYLFGNLASLSISNSNNKSVMTYLEIPK